MAKPYSYNHLVSERKHRKACRGFFGKDLIINAYGDLLGCCWDNTHLQTYGNIFVDDLEETRSGEKLSRMRAGLRNLDFTELPLCKQCYEVMSVSQFSQVWDPISSRTLGLANSDKSLIE